NPYRGLEAMTAANADYFYGRRAESVAVLNAFASRPDRFPILIGASGVGKSSIAQAGVLSAIKFMRWPGGDNPDTQKWPTGLGGSRGWASLTFRPGDLPLDALAGTFVSLWQLDPKDPHHAALPRRWANGLLGGNNTLADLVGATQEELKKLHG